MHVDLLYRDIDRVAAAIDDACAGKVERFYQPGHPHAFLPTIYMGEAASARLLHDPAGALAALQCRTTPYPAALAKDTKSADARPFLDYLKSARARPAFEKQGFTVLVKSISAT